MAREQPETASADPCERAIPATKQPGGARSVLRTICRIGNRPVDSVLRLGLLVVHIAVVGSSYWWLGAWRCPVGTVLFTVLYGPCMYIGVLLITLAIAVLFGSVFFSAAEVVGGIAA